jgi:hypothetical protein
MVTMKNIYDIGYNSSFLVSAIGLINMDVKFLQNPSEISKLHP